MAQLAPTASDHDLSAVVTLSGSLDRSSASSAREMLREARSDGRLVVDLSEVDSIDDAGVGVLLGIAHAHREHCGALVLTGARPMVRAALEAVGAQRVLIIVASVDASDRGFRH